MTVYVIDVIVDEMKLMKTCQKMLHIRIRKHFVTKQDTWNFCEFLKLSPPWMFLEFGHVFKNSPWNIASFPKNSVGPYLWHLLLNTCLVMHFCLAVQMADCSLHSFPFFRGVTLTSIIVAPVIRPYVSVHLKTWARRKSAYEMLHDHLIL